MSKNIGIWPCWYSSTFNTVGHASATVDLNPGPSWWQPPAGHYQLQVLDPPAGAPGRVSVALSLPRPQLPQSVHDVTVDNTLSQPIDVQHSWTYPGVGCGALIRPQFAVSVLYAQAQSIAFSQVKGNARITGPLISTAETQAQQIIRDNFIQPTVNALVIRSRASASGGWTLDEGRLRSAAKLVRVRAGRSSRFSMVISSTSAASSSKSKMSMFSLIRLAVTDGEHDVAALDVPPEHDLLRDLPVFWAIDSITGSVSTRPCAIGDQASTANWSRRRTLAPHPGSGTGGPRSG